MEVFEYVGKSSVYQDIVRAYMEKNADTISTLIDKYHVILSAEGNKNIALATIDALTKQTVKVLSTAYSRVTIAELADRVSETISPSQQHAVSPSTMLTLLMQ